MTFNHITKLDYDSFTVETVSGGCTLPRSKTVKQLEAHRKAWDLAKAFGHAPHQTYNQEIAQLGAYKLWREHLEGETT